MTNTTPARFTARLRPRRSDHRELVGRARNGDARDEQLALDLGDFFANARTDLITQAGLTICKRDGNLRGDRVGARLKRQKIGLHAGGEGVLGMRDPTELGVDLAEQRLRLRDLLLHVT